MSSDETPNVPSTRNSREAVREKAQQVHAQQKRARLMRRIIIGTLAVVAVGAVGTSVALAVGAQVAKPQLSPTGMKNDGVVVTAPVAQASSEDVDASTAEPTEAGTPEPTPEPTASDPVDIHVYVDYLSPDAGAFERANSRRLASWIRDGAATVTYHPVALLTASSNGTKYSLRAAAAAACVATHSPEQFSAFNSDLLKNQPEVGSDGLSDAELADVAGAVGADNAKAVRSCIEDGDFLSWVKAATTRALDGPLAGSDDLVLTSAPMIVANGEAYVGALDDPDELSQFVLSVAYYEETAPTPTPTPTATPSS